MLEKIKNNKLLSLILLLGSSLTLLTVIPSGSRYCAQDICGIFFWGAHEYDAVWHLALIHNAFSHVPFVSPIFSGAVLSGYNYLLDAIIWVFTLVGIPTSLMYFKILPVLWIALLIWITLKLTAHLKKDYIYSCFLFFFMFFGSTFMYMFNLYHSGTIFKLDSFGGAMNLINMQFGYSLIGLLAGIYVLITHKSSFRKDIIIGVLIFLVTAFKFYGGVVMGSLLVSYYIFQLLKDKDARAFIQSCLIVILGAGLAIWLIYDPFSATAGKEPILSMRPFSHTRSIIEEPDRFYLYNMVLARYYLLEHGWSPRLIAIEALSVGIFLFFHFGTRVIALWTIGYKVFLKKISQLDASIALAMLVGTVMMLLFVQRGQWWNTIQFFYYSLFLSSFFAADFMSQLLKKKTIARIVVAIVIVVLTLPFNIDVVATFALPNQPSSYISDAEMEGLNFLKKQPRGVVHAYIPPKNPQPHLWRSYEKDTAYVSAFSHKISYIAAEHNLQLLGTDYKDRMQKVRLNDPSIFNEIDYVFSYNSIGEPDVPISAKKIFANNEVTIYKIK